MSAVARRVLLTCALFLLLPGASSFPAGVGDVANEGCLCHGAQDEGLALRLEGLPEVYTPGTTYDLVLTGDASIDREGGFRLLVDGGTLLLGNGSGTQVLDGGVTHTRQASTSEGWNLSWTAPNITSATVHVVLHVNHVNGDGSSGGDRWASTSVLVLGPEADGTPEDAAPSLSTFGAEGFALLALVGMFVMMRYALGNGGKA